MARAQKAQASWESGGNEGISDLAPEELIDALHAVQDETSPEHSGFQAWGMGLGVGHVVREAVAAHTDRQAWQSGIDATRLLFLRAFGEQATVRATKPKEKKEEVTSTINYYVP